MSFADDAVGQVIQIKFLGPDGKTLEARLRDFYGVRQHEFNIRMEAFGDAVFATPRALPMPPDWLPGLLVTHRRGGVQLTDAAWHGMPVFIGDKLTTSPAIVASVEFVLGGRVGINHSSAVIVKERSVIDDPASISWKRVVLRKYGMWAKATNLREPLEIQTNGGVIGIKG